MTIGYNMRNKKGSTLDIWFYIAGIFLLGIIIVISYYSMGEINQKFNQSSVMTQQSKDMMNTSTTKFSGLAETIFLLGFFGSMVFVIISSFYIKTHPVFLPIGIVLLIIFGYLGIILSGTYTEITTANEGIEASASELTFIGYIMDNLTSIIVVMGMIVLIVLYMKNRIE